MKEYPFVYVSNYDGDTLTGTIAINLNHPIPNEELILKKTTTIRILDIDTPEIKSKVKEEKDMARIVKSEVAKWFAKHNEIKVLTNWNYDKHGRLLADFIDTESKVNLSSYLLSNGFAIAYQGETKQPFSAELLAKIKQSLV